MHETTYIVRIYRRTAVAGPARNGSDAGVLAGIVEQPATGERVVFHDYEGLWRILAGGVESHDSGER